ncbi:MAG: class I SAM-dependent methyltransferase [Bacteroidetes bacterium]|nr:class I SAM-dependent methyltransferase [Bacteroidota bacterium]
MDSPYPSCFARFYDLIYSKIRPDIDTDFFLSRIKSAKGPVMEVGTGTGRFFLEALKQGADIYGIDISPAMLDVLNARLGETEKSRVGLQDIRNFDTGFRFILVLAPFRVFMHLANTVDQLIALNHVYDQLLEGGSFIFDLYIPNPALLSSGMNEVMDFEGEYTPGNFVRRFVTSHSDMISQINHLTMRFDWNDGKLNFSETWNSELRFFFRYELEYLLQQSKFNSWSIFGDYHENPLSATSKEFVVVCRK